MSNNKRYSGIGGQAVMEGVMMKNKDTYAVSVRKPDGKIEVKIEEYKGVCKVEALKNIPFIRGVFNFVDSLVLGMRALTYSASFFEEDEKTSKQGADTAKDTQNTDISKNDKKEDLMMGMTVALSIVFAVVLFMLLPYGLSRLMKLFTDSEMLIAVAEGILRIIIFLAYVSLISLMEDIKRVYMYHGAEHKCINCIETGNELNVDNVRKASRLHKRCGTSFLLFVVVISVIMFMFIRSDNPIMRLGLRIVFIPVIAGISYEIIRWAGRSDNKIVQLLSVPGLCLQKITTAEPTDDMIEVAISSVEAVFDWREYLDEI